MIQTDIRMVKCAIVGSRHWENVELIDRIIAGAYKANPGLVVVSGAGGNVDKRAAAYAREQHIPLIEFPADWQQYGVAAGLLRNSQIVEVADCMLAFWDEVSNGTRDSIRKARLKPIPVKVYAENGSIIEP
jgi:hypothetical protein